MATGLVKKPATAASRRLFDPEVNCRLFGENRKWGPNLWTKLTDISQAIRVKVLSGLRVGVEASGWLYQGNKS